MDNGITNGTMDDAPSRRIKRKKHQRRTNGDAMDIDDGYGQSDQVSETDSAAPAVQDVPLLDSLAITEDRSVSTEKPRDIFPNSSFLDLPSNTSISHAEWSPDNPAPLLVGGTNCLRLYGIKSDTSLEAIHRDIEVNASDFDVVALSWLGGSDAAASIAEKFDQTDQTSESSARLLYISNWGSTSKVLSTLSGTVFALQYNSSSKMLLAISASASTTISIYQIGENSSPLCSLELHDNDLFDAAWMTPTKFIACGTNILQIYEVTPTEIRLLQTHESMSKAWFRIKYDSVCQIAAMVDEDMSILRQYNVATEDTRTQAFDATMTDFAFQPISNASAYDSTTQPRFLATSTDDGVVRLWDVRNPFTCLHRLSVPGLGDAVTMKQIAFSPDGYLLAGAGFDTVAIWKTEDGGQPKALWRCTDQEVWRSIPAEAGEGEGEGDDEWVHALSWDVHGRKLVFSLKDQVCLSYF
jgi:transducin (beta)-like 1